MTNHENNPEVEVEEQEDEVPGSTQPTISLFLLKKPDSIKNAIEKISDRFEWIKTRNLEIQSEYGAPETTGSMKKKLYDENKKLADDVSKLQKKVPLLEDKLSKVDDELAVEMEGKQLVEIEI